MTLTLTKGKTPTVVITRRGYFPVTFVMDGKTARVIHGVAFEGDRTAAMAAFNEPPLFATPFPQHGLERPEG
jgi:hypothetical protein